MFKPKRLKCLVCKRKSFVFEMGYCEKINDIWVVVKRENGYCTNCGFKYKESNVSLERQARKYKKKFIKKLVSKINKGGLKQ